MTKLYNITEPRAYKFGGNSDVAVGIDLGTTNSLIAVMEDGKPHLIADAESGIVMLPSIVNYLQDEVLVGELAGQFDGAISSVKRLIARPPADISVLQSHTSCDMQPSADGKCIEVSTQAGNKSAIEVSAEILKALKKRAESYLNKRIRNAVITVPAHFNEAGRIATKQAAQLAGLKVLRILNEPTAAALAFGLDKGTYGTYLVCDLGGGTFDVSIIRLTKGIFHVLATAGDVYLGGDDFDQAIINEMQLIYDVPMTPDALKQARVVKEHLTEHEEWRGKFAGVEGCTITRAKFVSLITPYLTRIRKIIRTALVDAELQVSDIDDVLMVGGATRIQCIRDMIAQMFGNPPLVSMNPDEVVAVGAAIQAANLTNGSGATLLDVTPLSLGIELGGGVVEVLLPRNSPVPAECVQQYTTMQDGQTAFIIHVVQGESSNVEECISLTRFELRGLQPLPAGKIKLEVRFRIDVDGLLTVDAHAIPSDVSHEVLVKPTYGLSPERILELSKS